MCALKSNGRRHNLLAFLLMFRSRSGFRRFSYRPMAALRGN